MCMDICIVSTCVRKAEKKKMCNTHYQKVRKGLNPEIDYRRKNKGSICSVEDCETLAEKLGYCGKHYQRWKKYGDVTYLARAENTLTGKYIEKSGYVRLYGHHDHPNSHKGGRIHEHVLVMSEKLGRPLFPGENVHHINGVRSDNNPDNLELWVTSQPAGQRPEDLVAWARQILERYDRNHGRST